METMEEPQYPSSPLSPLSPEVSAFSPEVSSRGRLPANDGESSEEESAPALHLPDNDGESSDEGGAHDFYTLSKAMVERKRAQQKRLNSLQLDSERDLGTNDTQSAPAKLAMRRRKPKEKTNHLYSAFVPVFILKRLKELVARSPSFEARAPAAVLLMRVAGLTSLINKLHNQFVGPRNLCVELDKFYGYLTHAADAAGGDTVKIDGDTVLFMWSVDGPEGPKNLGDATKAAARFAHQTREYLATRPAVEGIKLGVSSGLGCGTVSCLNLVLTGTEGMSTYAEFVVAGAPLEQMRRASLAATSDVVCSKVAWAFLRTTYDGTEEGELVRLRGASAGADSDPGGDQIVVEVVVASTGTDDEEVKSCPSYQPRLRPAISRTLVGVDLRKLIMFVPRSFDRALRFRYAYASYLEHAKISEMRQLTVCAMRIYGVDFVDAAFALAQEVVNCVHSTVERLHGSTLKMRCDGLGMHVLLCFGLPGSVYEKSPLRALAAVYLLKERIAEKVGEGLRYWIGIATDWAFCGVVGDALRMEYMVAGEAVDAARTLEETCGTPSVLAREPGHVLLVCGTTARQAKLEVNLEECRVEVPGGKTLRAYVPLGWKQRNTPMGFSRNPSSAHKARVRMVADIFEHQTKVTCAIGGICSAAATHSFIEETITILSRFHKMTLLRTQRSVSACDDGSLALNTMCGAWRAPVVTALDVIEAYTLRRRTPFGYRSTTKSAAGSTKSAASRMIRSPRRGPSSDNNSSSSNSSSYNRGGGDGVLSDPPLSPQQQSSVGSPWRSSSSFRSMLSGAQPGPGSYSSKSPPPSTSKRQRPSLSTNQPILARGRSLGHLLSGKRGAASENDPHRTQLSLIGRTSAIHAALPPRLHKYAAVLNDMFMPEERNPQLLNEDHLRGVTPMMRRARLVQLVVMVVLQASKRARITLLLDNLDQMDDASWDVLYKITQWQKKAVNGTLPIKQRKKLKRRMTKFIKSPSLLFGSTTNPGGGGGGGGGGSSGGASTSGAGAASSSGAVEDATSPNRKSEAPTDGIDMLQYSNELMSNNQFLVFVVAPRSSATGLERAEWLETRRLALASDTYIEMARLHPQEARLYAAERLKLCNASASDFDRERALNLVADCPLLDEFVAMALGEPDVLNALLSEAKETGRVAIQHHGPGLPTLRVSDDLETLDLPQIHATPLLTMVDELSVWKQQVMIAASIFRREFTPRLLVGIALEGMDLLSAATVCQDLCTPQDSGRTMFNRCASDAADDDVSLREDGEVAYGSRRHAADESYQLTSGERPSESDLLVAMRGEVFEFAEPLVQRALVARLSEPQVETVFRRLDALAVSRDDKAQLLDLVSPYVAKKHARVLATYAAAPASSDTRSVASPAHRQSTTSHPFRIRFRIAGPSADYPCVAKKSDHVRDQLRPASVVAAV